MDLNAATQDASFARWQTFWAQLQPPDNPRSQQFLIEVERRLASGQSMPATTGGDADLLPGMSPAAIIRLGRIRRAIVLLENQSPDAVAKAVGLVTPTRLRAAFSEVTGYSLTEYAKLRATIILHTAQPPIHSSSIELSRVEIQSFHDKMLALGSSLPSVRAKSGKDYAILKDRLAGHTLDAIALRVGSTKTAVSSALTRIEGRYVRNESSALQTIARLEGQIEQLLEHNSTLILAVREHSGMVVAETQSMQARNRQLQDAFISLAVRAEIHGVGVSAEEMGMMRGEVEPRLASADHVEMSVALKRSEEAVRTLTEALKVSEIARHEHMESAKKWRDNYRLAVYGAQQ